MRGSRCLRVLFVGDVVPNALHRPSQKAQELVRSYGADSVIGNCEISLTERGVPAAKFVTWRTAPSAAESLRWLGFNAVSLANNHMLDYGREGLADTLTALRSAGIQTMGAGANLVEAMSEIRVPHAGGARLACLGVACTLPLGSPADADQPGVCPIRVSTSYEFDPLDLQEEPGCQPTRIHTHPDPEDLGRICRKIHELKDEGWTVAVSIHWGNAFQKQLASYQSVLGRAFAEAGCDVVVGHHPHTTHGIECIGAMPVFYSLGNFLMDSQMAGYADSGLPEGLATPWIMSDEALVVVVDMTAEGVEEVCVHPIRLDPEGYPTPLSPADAEVVLHQVEAFPPGRPPWAIRDGRAALIRA